MDYPGFLLALALALLSAVPVLAFVKDRQARVRLNRALRVHLGKAEV